MRKEDSKEVEVDVADSALTILCSSTTRGEEYIVRDLRWEEVSRVATGIKCTRSSWLSTRRI